MVCGFQIGRASRGRTNRSSYGQDSIAQAKFSQHNQGEHAPVLQVTVMVTIADFVGSALLMAMTWNVPVAAGAV